MDHMGDWMLPGAVLVLLMIGGIVLVMFDDIVPTLLNSRRKAADPASGGSTGDAPLEARSRKKLRRKR